MEKKKDKKFDLILFGSSFMLLLDRSEAIRIAKSLLNPNGLIVFLLTLYDDNTEHKWMEIIKPKLKYITTADFGKVVYKQQFNDEMNKGGLEIVQMKRVCQKFNPVLKVFDFYSIECKVK